MKAYILKRPGNPEVLKIDEKSIPEPSQGQVRVEVHYIGLNYAEILSRKGLYGWAPKRPYVLGMECVGEIDAVGPSVPKNVIGEQVMVGTQYGCYAEYVTVPRDQVITVIPRYSLAESAAFPVNYLTAWVGLVELGRICSEDNVLITAAAGGVGTAAVQLASAQGCRVSGLVGSEGKKSFVIENGAQNAATYDEFILSESKQSTYSLVIEVVGGKVFRSALRSLSPYGRIIVLGYAGLDLKLWNPLSWYHAIRDIPRAKIMTLAERSIGLFE
jgi:NADPH:quinone reductase-like Zn-dependent oxidoreductase